MRCSTILLVPAVVFAQIPPDSLAPSDSLPPSVTMPEDTSKTASARDTSIAPSPSTQMVDSIGTPTTTTPAPTPKSPWRIQLEAYTQHSLVKGSRGQAEYHNDRDKVEANGRWKHTWFKANATVQIDLAQWGQKGFWDESWIGAEAGPSGLRFGLQKSPLGLDSKLGSRDLWFGQRSALAEHWRRDLDIAGTLPALQLRNSLGNEHRNIAINLWLLDFEHHRGGSASQEALALPVVEGKAEGWGATLRYLAGTPEMAYVINERGDLRRQRYLLQEFWAVYASPYVEGRLGAVWTDDALDTLSSELYWDDKSYVKYATLAQVRGKWRFLALSLGYERSQWTNRAEKSWQYAASAHYKTFARLDIGDKITDGTHSPFVTTTLSYDLEWPRKGKRD